MEKWTVDVNHSEVQFKVKHLALSNVTGTFRVFKGEVEAEGDDFNNAKINFEIDAASVDTKVGERDNFLKSPHFLDIAQFPQILFNGTMNKKADGYEIEGEVNLHGIKKNLTLAVEFNGIGKGKQGDTRAGFEVNGKINRKDFGLIMDVLTEAGSLLMGEEIKLHFDVELIKLAS